MDFIFVQMIEFIQKQFTFQDGWTMDNFIQVPWMIDSYSEATLKTLS